MNKEPTRTIYDCLEHSFWTQRKCHACQKVFTSADYLNQNYQLYFEKVVRITKVLNQQNQVVLDYAFLEKVLVKLSHQQCPFSCGFSFEKDICNQR